MRGKLLVVILLILAALGGFWIYKKSQSTISVSRPKSSADITQETYSPVNFANILSEHAPYLKVGVPDKVSVVQLPGQQGAEYTANYAYIDAVSASTWYSSLLAPENGWEVLDDSFNEQGRGQIVVGKDGAVLRVFRDAADSRSTIGLTIYMYEETL